MCEILFHKIRKGSRRSQIGERIDGILKENNLKGISIANYNSDDQIVISGDKGEIKKAELIFKKSGAKMYFILPVSGAFHTSYMQNAKQEFSRFLEKFKFNAPCIPVISNVTAQPYEKDEISRLLAEQIVSPVRWTESIRFLKEQGDMEFEEIGPGKVLTKLISKIRPLKPEDQAKNKKSLSLSGKKSNRNNNFMIGYLAKSGSDFVFNPHSFKGIIQSSVRKPIYIIFDPVKKMFGLTVEGNIISEPSQNDSFPLAGIIPSLYPEWLGDRSFQETHNLRFSYVGGAMARGIASAEMVVELAKSGMLGFFGSAGLSIERIERETVEIKNQLDPLGYSWGSNLIHSPHNPYF